MPDEHRYIQVAYRLRVQRGPGRADLYSERPVRKNSEGHIVEAKDDPDNFPTIVTFDEHCRVDIPALLKLGAIKQYSEPPVTPIASGRGKRSG